MINLRKNRRAVIIIAAFLFVVLFVVLFVFVTPRLNVPEPRQHSFLIFAGSASRAILSTGYAKSQTGKFSPPRRPRSVEFTSSNGPVNVFIFAFDATGGEGEVTRMMELTKSVASGEEPTGAIASATGVEGTIDLNWWPYGWGKYLAIVGAEQQTEVLLTVRY